MLAKLVYTNSSTNYEKSTVGVDPIITAYYCCGVYSSVQLREKYRRGKKPLSSDNFFQR